MRPNITSKHLKLKKERYADDSYYILQKPHYHREK